MLSASEAGPPPKRIVVAYGFWIFLLSDIVMFSALFAAHAVLMRATAGGPSGVALFNTNAAANGAYGAADPVPRNPTTETHAGLNNGGVNSILGEGVISVIAMTLPLTSAAALVLSWICTSPKTAP
jgi:heme/copper-type cytochrome/quinol oxidase subunit 3